MNVPNTTAEPVKPEPADVEQVDESALFETPERAAERPGLL